MALKEYGKWMLGSSIVASVVLVVSVVAGLQGEWLTS